MPPRKLSALARTARADVARVSTFVGRFCVTIPEYRCGDESHAGCSSQSVMRESSPSRSISRRSRSSARALVGPILPIGMSRAADISS